MLPFCFFISLYLFLTPNVVTAQGTESDVGRGGSSSISRAKVAHCERCGHDPYIGCTPRLYDQIERKEIVWSSSSRAGSGSCNGMSYSECMQEAKDKCNGEPTCRIFTVPREQNIRDSYGYYWYVGGGITDKQTNNDWDLFKWSCLDGAESALGLSTENNKLKRVNEVLRDTLESLENY